MIPNQYSQSLYISNLQQPAPLPFGYGQNSPQSKTIFQPQPPHDMNYVEPARVEMQTIQQQPQTANIPPRKIDYIIPQKTIHGKFSYLVDWFLYILPIAYFILILIVMALLLQAKVKHYNPEEAHNTLETLKNNLAQNPIEDIVIAQRTTSSALTMIEYYSHQQVDCPAGYSKALIGQWDGVNSGCICDNGQISHAATCFYKSGCNRVSEHEKAYFSVWNTQSFCTKQYNDWEPLEGAECKQGKKLCGNICVPSDKKCPLSDLQVQAAAPAQASDQFITIGDKTYKKQFESDTQIISFEAVPGLGQDKSSPCYNNQLNPQFQSQKYYPLAKRPEKGCDKYGDLQSHRFTLATEKATITYTENGLNQIITSLPFYSNYQNQDDTYALEAIKRIVINSALQCQKIKPSQIDSISKNSKKIYQSERVISITLVIITGLILLFVPFLYIARNRIFQWIDMTDFHQPKFLCSIGILIAILTIGLGAVYISEVDGPDGLKVHNESFNGYIENNCFPDESLKGAVKEVYTFSKNTYYTTYDYVLASFYISIIFLILLVVLLVYQYYTHKSLFDNPWQPVHQPYQEFH